METPNNLECMSIRKLGLSESVLEAVSGRGIVMAGELFRVTPKELLDIPGIGAQGVVEIDRALEAAI